MLNSYDEWTQLVEVIVGTGIGYNEHCIDTSFNLFYIESLAPQFSKYKTILKNSNQVGNSRRVQIPQIIIDELNEDIEGLVKALTGCGVKVLRPESIKSNLEITSPYWQTSLTPALNVRDQTIVLGNNIVETAPHVRSRYFENDALKPIFYGYFETGCHWLTMPKPTLTKDSIDVSYFTKNNLEVDSYIEANEKWKISSLGYEMIFDGAQCMRFGKDVLVNVANENHYLGYKWLKRQLGHFFKFHKLKGMADNHIDSTIMPLRPGLLLLRSKEFLKYLPPELRKWEVLVPPEAKKARFPSYKSYEFNLASKYIDMNVLSINENCVIVNTLYPELIEQLEDKNFSVIPVQHRHRRLFGGGFHCFTLDTVREGGLESYL